MRRVRLLHGLAAVLLSAVGAASGAAAQDSGGIGFGPAGVSAANLAQAFAQPVRQPVFASAARRGAPPGAMVTNPARSRKEVHQQLIAKTRGDAGFLAGFQQGQPLAASRNPPPQIQPSLTFIDAPFIVNNVNSALNIAFGEGNAVGQGVSAGGGGEPVSLETASGGTDETPARSSAPAATPAAVAEPAKPAVKPVSEPSPQKPGPKPGKAPDFLKMPELPALPKLPSAQPDALMTTLGPLPHLPHALQNGGVRFNNVNSAVNIAAGIGNLADQSVTMIQR